MTRVPEITVGDHDKRESDFCGHCKVIRVNVVEVLACARRDQFEVQRCVERLFQVKSSSLQGRSVTDWVAAIVCTVLDLAGFCENRTKGAGNSLPIL